MRLGELRNLYDRFNVVYFSSKLKRPHILIKRAKHYYGYWYPGEIAISNKKNKSQIDYRDTLMHEMVHQYVTEVLKVKEADHGPVWTEEALKRGVQVKHEFT